MDARGEAFALARADRHGAHIAGGRNHRGHGLAGGSGELVNAPEGRIGIGYNCGRHGLNLHERVIANLTGLNKR
ncbi:MAG: hypothetical protein WAL41_11660 [Mycobacterium sp.]